MTIDKIGKFEAICLVLIPVINHVLLEIPRDVITLSATSSILNIAFVSIVALFFCIFVVKCFSRFSNYDIIDISEFLGGKFLKIIIGVLFLIYLVIASSGLLRLLSEILKITYLTNLDINIITAVFLFAAIIANYFGGNSIIKTNMIIVPVMFLVILLSFAFSVSRFSIQNMFPILGYGINETFFVGLSNIFAFSGICILYFLPPLLKENVKFKKITYISYVITAVFLILSIACVLFFISSIFALEELSPIYLLVRTASFGEFLERPEALFVLFWIMAFISYLSFIVLLGVIIMKKIFKIENKKISTLIFSPLIFLLAVLPRNITNATFISSTVYKYSTLGLIFVIVPIILFFAYFKKRKKDKNSHIERRDI